MNTLLNFIPPSREMAVLYYSVSAITIIVLVGLNEYIRRRNRK